jgi:ppGpp synthetase/RelA/SpoT-type nucleotidyltranferase
MQTEQPEVIKDFVNRYRREYDYYQQLASIAAQQCEAALQENGIKAMVTNRAKRLDSLEKKIQQRMPENLYQSTDDIYNDIVDLAGVRIALYFPGGRSEVDKIICGLFDVEDTKEFPVVSDKSEPLPYEKRFTGYYATHYRVCLKKSSLTGSQMRYANGRVEIQVASVLMHAWAEVEHDLIYKPSSGKLSVDEHAILDELNGLVLAGEIALERLQRALEGRIESQGQIPFANHYELAAYLYEKVKSLIAEPDDSIMGRVDILFELLNRADLNSPGKIAPYISSFDKDTENRPIAQQITDQVIATDLERYGLYEDARIGKETEGLHLTSRRKDQQQAIGSFLLHWTAYEKIVRELTNRRISTKGKYVFPRQSILFELELFDKEVLGELEATRHFRNNLVHGIEVPDAEYIRKVENRLKYVLRELSESEDQEVQQITLAALEQQQIVL